VKSHRRKEKDTLAYGKIRKMTHQMQNQNPCTQSYSTPHKHTPARDINKDEPRKTGVEFDGKCHDHRDKVRFKESS
jgi:hypothetical protein